MNDVAIKLVEITPANWPQFTRLEVAESQRKFVDSNVLILARAHVYRAQAAQVWGISRTG